MFTEISTIEELKEMFVEIMLNKTDKISKISDGSVNNGIAFGNAKIAQKIMKDVAVLESHLFPDSSFGEYLDNTARLKGISQRFGPRQSSTYLRIVGDRNTVYEPNINVFSSSSGVKFDLEKQIVIPEFGYCYAKVRSQIKGLESNVDALTINKVSNQPSGHKYCINEYSAQYGSDSENDDTFRKRIQDGVNILSRGTVSMLEQSFMKINENVMKIYHNGFDSFGRTIISILTINGVDLTDSELNDILIRSEKFFNISELRPNGVNGSNVVLQNIQWQPVDISTRVEIESSYNPDDIRRDIQIRLNKYIDYRRWKLGQKIEWDNLLDIVKNTNGVRYISDNFFHPRNDISVDLRKLPRLRGFQLLNLDGSIIKDIQGNLNPIFYPNDVDFSYQSTVLKTI
jgi:uncharacterized phage protein gp47/JayE